MFLSPIVDLQIPRKYELHVFVGLAFSPHSASEKWAGGRGQGHCCTVDPFEKCCGGEHRICLICLIMTQQLSAALSSSLQMLADVWAGLFGTLQWASS